HAHLHPHRRTRLPVARTEATPALVPGLTSAGTEWPGRTTNVRADAGTSANWTPRVMKNRMIFPRAGMHTSACAEHDKAACVIAGSATSGSGECTLPRLRDPRRGGELKTSCARWMMSPVAPRLATLDLLSRFEEKGS